jgi:hypothetical protein
VGIFFNHDARRDSAVKRIKYDFLNEEACMAKGKEMGEFSLKSVTITARRPAEKHNRLGRSPGWGD